MRRVARAIINDGRRSGRTGICRIEWRKCSIHAPPIIHNQIFPLKAANMSSRAERIVEFYLHGHSVTTCLKACFVYNSHLTTLKRVPIVISQMMRYSMTPCGSYHEFFDKGSLLSKKIQSQIILVVLR